MADCDAPKLTFQQKAELKAKLEDIYKPLLEQGSFQAEYEKRKSMENTAGVRDVLVVDLTSEETIDCLEDIIGQVEQIEDELGGEVWKGTIINDYKDGRMEMWVVPMMFKPEEGSVGTYSVEEIAIETDLEWKISGYMALVNITLDEEDED